ncbi:MAG: DoxX family protein [Candidatus Omnitrophota bacterium]
MLNTGLLVLRLGLGAIFMAHGLQKAFGVFTGTGISGFSKMLSGLGFYPPVFWAYIAAYVELLSGLFLIFGILTRVSAFFLLVLMLVATIKVHLAKGFFLANGGFEYNLLIACACLALLLMGGGQFSLFKSF